MQAGIEKNRNSVFSEYYIKKNYALSIPSMKFQLPCQLLHYFKLLNGWLLLMEEILIFEKHPDSSATMLFISK